MVVGLEKVGLIFTRTVGARISNTFRFQMVLLCNDPEPSKTELHKMVVASLFLPFLIGLSKSFGIRQVLMQNIFDKQSPVFYLPIRQWSKDLKHLIPKP